MSGPAASFFSDGVRAPALPSLIEAELVEKGRDFFSELDPAAQDAVIAREQRGEFTGERLFLQRRGVYDAIVRLLGEGRLGVKAIGSTLGVSVNTVRAVRDREPGAVDTQRAKTVKHLADFVELAAGRLADEAGEMPLGQLAVPLGIAVEKMQLLTGGATARVEIVEVPPVDAFNDYIAGLPTVTGLGTGERRQKGAADPGAGGDRAAGGDERSLVSGASEPVGCADATPLATLPADPAETASGAQGGRGSLKATPPPTSPIGLSGNDSGTNGMAGGADTGPGGADPERKTAEDSDL